MRVVYSGCNWNSVVFAMDSSQIEFEAWLTKLWDKFQEIVRSDPAKFKVSSRRGPAFPSSIVVQSRDPDLYPNELRCRLSTRRTNEGDVECTAVIRSNDESIRPDQVWSGGYMTPILKLGYYKNGDDFGLSITVIAANYIPPERRVISNVDWVMDTTES